MIMIRIMGCFLFSDKTSVAEPKIFLSAPAPWSRKSEFLLRLRFQPRRQLNLQHILKIYIKGSV